MLRGDAAAHRAAPVAPSSMPAPFSRINLWAASSSSSSSHAALDSSHGHCDAGYLAAATSKELVVYQQHAPLPAAAAAATATATIADATVHLTLPASFNVVATHPLASPLSRHTARGPAKMQAASPPLPTTHAAVEILLLAPPPVKDAIDASYVAAHTRIVVAQPTCRAPPSNSSASAATAQPHAATGAAAATAAAAAATTTTTPADGAQPEAAEPQTTRAAAAAAAAAVPFVARVLCSGQPRCTAAAISLLESMSAQAATSTLIARSICAGEPRCAAAASTFVASLAPNSDGTALAARMMCGGQRRCSAAAASTLHAVSQSARPNATSLAANVLCAGHPRCSAATAATLSSLGTSFDAAGVAAAALCVGQRRCVDAVGSATFGGVLRAVSTLASAALGAAYRVFGEAALRPRSVRDGAFGGAHGGAVDAASLESRAYYGPARYMAPPSCAAPAIDAQVPPHPLFATNEAVAGMCPAAPTAPAAAEKTDGAEASGGRHQSPLMLWLLLCASAGVGLLLLAGEEAAAAPWADHATTPADDDAASEETTPPPPPFPPPASPMDAYVTPMLQPSFGVDDQSDVDDEEADDDHPIEPRESVRALSMGARALAATLDEAAGPKASLKALQAKTPIRSTPRRSQRVKEAEKRSSRRGFLLPPTPPLR